MERGAVSEADWGDRTLRFSATPPVSLWLTTSPKVNCPAGAREGGLGHYSGEALGAAHEIATGAAPQ